MRVKLSQCQQRLGLYQAAINELKAVLRAHPKNLEAQLSAAETYQQWGHETGNVKKLEIAINGEKPRRAKDKDEKIIWGWAQLTTIARRLPKYKETFYKARYNWVFCRARASFIEDKEAELKRVESQILAMHRADPKMGGENWYGKFDQLLQSVQRKLKKSVTPLKEVERQRAEASKKKK